MAQLVVFGTGDVARLARRYFDTDSPHDVVGFVVDDDFVTEDTFDGLPLSGFSTVTDRYPPAAHEMFIALSYGRMNHLRAERYAAAKAKGYRLASYVSSRCTWLTDHPIGDNSFIFEDNTVQPFVEIGSNVILWSGNHIGHDSVVRDHCFIASQVVVSGHCTIEPYCFLGVNATLRNGITLGEASLIGAGAVIMKDTEPFSVYVPDRAKRLDRVSTDIEM